MQVLQEYFLQVLQGFLIYLAHILEILQVLHHYYMVKMWLV